MTVFSILPLWLEPTNKHKTAQKKKRKLAHDARGPRKLTVEQVREIRWRFKHETATTYRTLAAEYGCNWHTIKAVVDEITWCYIR